MGSGDSVIETGVDKLVKLVTQKKKISLKQAAKALDVTPNVIEEWADFLEEEGIISIDYALTNTYLLERKLNEKEITKKAKDFHNRKEAFVRKAENTLSVIDKEGESLREFKSQFNNFKKDLGNDFDYIKKELVELDKLQKLKNQVDLEMHNQQRDFRQKIDSVDRKIQSEQKRYAKILKDIETEKKELVEELSKAKLHRSRETELLKKLEAYMDAVKELKKGIDLEDRHVSDIESHIRKLDSLAETVKSEVLASKKKLDDIIAENRKNEDRILNIQKEIIAKVNDRKKHIDKTVRESSDSADKFKAFFSKKDDVEKMLLSIEKDIHDLKDELQGLIQKSRTFSLTVRNSDAKAYITKLEKKLRETEKKRDGFRKKMRALMDMIHK